MSDTKRKRPASTPEPTDDMRAWLRGEGTIICELPDGSRRQLTAAECFAGPQRTDRKPVMQEGRLSRSEVPSLPGTISTLAPRIADEQGRTVGVEAPDRYGLECAVSQAGPSLIRTALLPAAALVSTLATGTPAFAEFTIAGARIAEGDLWVIGQVDEPNTSVTLDGSYTETSDSRGRFQFRIAYHPATCTVILKTEKQSRAVVVANCGQRGPQGEAGPPGPPGSSVPIRQTDQPQPERAQASEPACDTRAAIYEADKGLKLWVTRRGTIERDAALSPLSDQGPDVVLQVNVGGSIATAYGPDFASLLRGGPPEQLEGERGRRIAWSTQLDRLPDALQVVSEDGAGALARFRFKQCGAAPSAKPDTPRRVKAKPRKTPPPPEAGGQEAPSSLPIPQGAIQ